MTTTSEGERVIIRPIDEDGTVKKIRLDEQGQPLIDVMRDSDKKIHVCRLSELERMP